MQTAMQITKSNKMNFSGSPVRLRGFAVALVLLATTGILSAQGGGGGFRGGPRFSGLVTAVTVSSITAKNEAGVAYTITITADTRLMRRGQDGPEEINPTDVKVGDVINAGGQIDESAHTVAAMNVIDITGEQAAALVANEANLGKTWVAGKVTAIDGATLTILRNDGVTQKITADDSTSITRAPQRGGGYGGGAPAPDPITMADIKVGDNVSATGALKGDAFVPAKLTVGGMPAGYGGPQAGFGGGGRRPGGAQQ